MGLDLTTVDLRTLFYIIAVIGERLGKWVSTPFDLLAFGPRVGAGALVSMPERLQTL